MPPNGYVIAIDPSEMANRFAAAEEDPEENNVPDDEGVAAFFAESYEDKISPLLEKIPQREADLIYLYYIQKKRQADIAEIFGVTQAAISYRLDRGIHRIKFLLEIPEVTEEDMRNDLAKIFPKIDINILCGMWRTTCQSEVASTLQLTQGRVRHRFFKAVIVLKEAAGKDAIFAPYAKIFSTIADKNFNALREVSLPQWGGRGGDECI